MYCLLLFALVASVSADTCPEEVTPIQHFNLASFASGTWYEVARYPNVYEEGFECGSTTYSNTVPVIRVQYNFVKSHKAIIAHGTVKIANKTSDLGVVINALPLGAYNAYQDYVLNILDIEYDKYYIACHCQNGGKVLAWIYSRTQTLSAYSMAKVEKFLKNSNVLYEENFLWPQFTLKACRIDTTTNVV